MQIRFDVDFDGYPWPGPLGAASAAFGEAWVGPAAFLGLLEVQLGLNGPVIPQALRAAALVPAIHKTAGFWSKSAEVDPMGTAATLLRWRDLLWSAGWRGQHCSARLKDLSQLQSAMKPGIADRMDDVGKALAESKTDIKRLELTEPRIHYSHSWRTIFDALERMGTEIVEASVEAVKSQGDLLGSKSRPFQPTGDGRLQLLRPQGPQAASEAVAAWLAQSDEVESTVIISTDPLLDGSLRRHGLPTMGASAGSRGSSLLQILPLVVQLGWSPPDPARALELLTLASSPVPRSIRHRLVDALKEWPAVGSQNWKTALAEGLTKIEDVQERKKVADRLEVLLTPKVNGAEYPASELQKRVQTLVKWLQGNIATKEDEVEEFQAAVIQCSNFLRLLELVQLHSLKKSQLQRLLEDATAEVPTPSRFPAQAGIHSVSGPGAIGGAVERVVWWNFTRDSAPKPDSVPLTLSEKKALADAGVVMPEPAQTALRMNARWGRPLQFTRAALMFVCPKYGDDGSAQHPHPLWDQIAANAIDDRSLGKIIVSTPMFPKSVKTQKHQLLAMPKARTEWHINAKSPIASREKESPSGAGCLVGCSFKWTLDYVGKIRGGETADLPANEQLVGSLAHEILARVLKSNPASPAAAQSLAQQIFDSDGPLLAAVLFMPGAGKPREQSRRATARAAFSLTSHIQNAGMKVTAVETDFDGTAFGAAFSGRTDLVAGSPDVVIDMKWSGEKYRRTELQGGAAYQLASYSRLVGKKTFVPTAYFIISTQVLLTTHCGLFKDAIVVSGAGPEEIWKAFESAYLDRQTQLRSGLLIAPGARDEKGALIPSSSALEDGKLLLTPPCRYCSFGVLCGHGLELDAAVAASARETQ